MSDYEKDKILDFTNCGLVCLTKIELYMWEKRGCVNADPDWDEKCNKCVFLHEPTYPDSARTCILGDAQLALEQFKEERMKDV